MASLENKVKQGYKNLKLEKKMKMPFGKFEGTEIEEIPKDYLQWIGNNLDLYGDLRTAIFDELCGVDGEKLRPKSNEELRV